MLEIVCCIWLAAGTVPSVNSDAGCTNPGDGLHFDGSGITCGAATRPTKTIGTLPTCNAASRGQMYLVTDVLLPAALAAVAAGGAVTVGVTCNGASWIVQ